MANKTENIVGKCFFGPPASFFALKEGRADIDTLERLAILYQTVPGQICVFRGTDIRPALLKQNGGGEGRKLKNSLFGPSALRRGRMQVKY